MLATQHCTVMSCCCSFRVLCELMQSLAQLCTLVMSHDGTFLSYDMQHGSTSARCAIVYIHLIRFGNQTPQGNRQHGWSKQGLSKANRNWKRRKGYQKLAGENNWILRKHASALLPAKWQVNQQQPNLKTPFPPLPIKIVLARRQARLDSHCSLQTKCQEAKTKEKRKAKGTCAVQI